MKQGKLKEGSAPKTDQDWERNCCSYQQGCKMMCWLWKTVWKLLTKLSIFLSFHLATVCLGFYQNNLTFYILTKMNTWISVEAFLIIGKTWKHTNVSFRGWTGQTVVDQDEGILFSNEKYWDMKPCKNKEKTDIRVAKWKKSLWRSSQLCNVLEKQRY